VQVVPARPVGVPEPLGPVPAGAAGLVVVVPAARVLRVERCWPGSRRRPAV